MEISIVLAKIFGVYLTIFGLVILKDSRLQAVITELLKNVGTRFVLGTFTLIIGILLINIHNIWKETYQIVITLFSWAIFLKGLTAVWLKDENYNKLVEKLNTKSMLTLSGVINLVLGLYFSYIGFFI